MTTYLLVGMFLAAARAGSRADRYQIAKLRFEGRSEGEILTIAFAVTAALILLWPVWVLAAAFAAMQAFVAAVWRR